MNDRRKLRSSKGFTLIELLTVMAIIALLAAILIPAVSKVMANARRSQVSHNMGQIAQAYATYMHDGDKVRIMTANDIYDLALELARDGGINDAELYIATDDPRVQAAAAAAPDAVAFNDAGTWSLNPAFDGYPLSLVIVSGIPGNAPPTSTPVAWTRGLLANGTWAPETAANPGVFGNRGGYIAFLDGHVEWFRDLRGSDGNGALRNYATQRPTANIADALPPGVTVLEAE